MNTPNTCSGTKRQRGFTLLEVMVALVIFSIGLLGLADLQIRAVDYNNGAYQRSQASFLISDIMDRMRANKNAAVNGNYDIALKTVPPQATCSKSTSNCDVAAQTAADLSEWKNALKVLPGGDGSVSHTTNGSSTTFTVSVSWNDANTSTGKSTLTVKGEL